MTVDARGAAAAAPTDVNGASIGGYDYSPYGKATVLGSADNNRIRYLGQYQETNNSSGDQVYKFGARYYTTSGAFTQPDAMNGNLSDPRTMTAYNYAGGDPINQEDASGYCSKVIGSPRGYRTESVESAGGQAGTYTGCSSPPTWGCVAHLTGVALGAVSFIAGIVAAPGTAGASGVAAWSGGGSLLIGYSTIPISC